MTSIEEMAGAFIDLARWLHAVHHDGPFNACTEGSCPDHRRMIGHALGASPPEAGTRSAEDG